MRALGQAVPRMALTSNNAAAADAAATAAERAEALSSTEKAQITLSASNEYTASHGYAGREYRWLETGSLVEPHRHATLSARLPTTVTPTSVRMHWHAGPSLTSPGMLEGALGDDGVSYQVTSLFAVPGQYTVEVEVTTASGGVSSVARTLTCRYVRREIRALTHDDRERFFGK